MNSNSRYSGRCVNVPACSLAAQGQDLTFEPGQPAVCPACGSPVEILGVAWNQNSTTEQRLPPASTPLPQAPISGGVMPSPVHRKTPAGVWIAIAGAAVLVLGLIGFGIFKAVVSIAMEPGVLSSPDPTVSADAQSSPALIDATTAPAGDSTAAAATGTPPDGGTSTHEIHVVNATSDQVTEFRYAGPGVGFDANDLLSPIAPGGSGSGYRPDSVPCTVDIMATIGNRPVYKDGVDICSISSITISNPTSDDPTEWHFRKDVPETGVPAAYAPE